MEKLFKILKVVFYALLFALAITFVVCLFAIPQETKDFVKGFIVFINQPLPIVGISLITLGFIVYKIIDITPIGRKGYNAIKEDFHKEQDKLIGYKEILEDKIKECEKTKNETIGILSSYSKEIDTLTDNLLKVCETSPNAKIKALGEQLKEQSDNLKVEINEKYDDTKNDLAKVVESRKYDLETILKELQELKEKVYGEETKDN